MKFSSAIFLSLFCLSACSEPSSGGDSSSHNSNQPIMKQSERKAVGKKILIVASSKDVCHGMMQQLCLKVREPDAPEYRFLYDSIAGFEFVWGHKYNLTVSEHPKEQAPQDASTLNRHLVSVLTVEEDALGTKYSYTGVGLNPHTITSGSGDYRFLGQKFTCREPQICSALLTAVATVKQADLLFEYRGNGEIELVEWREVKQG